MCEGVTNTIAEEEFSTAFQRFVFDLTSYIGVMLELERGGKGESRDDAP
jgi:hypothetical protein